MSNLYPTNTEQLAIDAVDRALRDSKGVATLSEYWRSRLEQRVTALLVAHSAPDADEWKKAFNALKNRQTEIDEQTNRIRAMVVDNPDFANAFDTLAKKANGAGELAKALKEIASHASRSEKLRDSAISYNEVKSIAARALARCAQPDAGRGSPKQRTPSDAAPMVTRGESRI